MSNDMIMVCIFAGVILVYGLLMYLRNRGKPNTLPIDPAPPHADDTDPYTPGIEEEKKEP